VKKAIGLVVQWGTVCSVLFVLWRYVIAPNTSPGLVGRPGPTWHLLTTWTSDGTLWAIIRSTLSEALVGFALGSALGVVVALAVGLLPEIVGEIVEPAVTALYAMPKFVLIPSIIVLFQTGFVPRSMFVTIVLFPAMFIFTVTGVRTVDPDRSLMFRLLGASRTQVARKLLLPHTMSYVATGLTFSAPHALTIAIGAEILFGVQDGIGGRIFNSAAQFQAPAVFAALIVGTVLSALGISASRKIGEHLLAPAGDRS
jgi:NitT/TauT family transport system permease protein